MRFFTNGKKPYLGGLPRFWMYMKLTVLFTLVACLHVSAAALAQRVTLKVKNASLIDVFEDIRRQSDVDFVYRSSQISLAKPISVQVNQMPLENVLSLIFEGQPLTYSIQNKTIVVKQKTGIDTDETVAEPKRYRQQPITGLVSDSLGNALAGVSVMIKGTNRATFTNNEGRYSIQAQSGDILVFSFIGHGSQETVVSSNYTINVILADRVSALDEVIVVGYGTQRRINLTGAVSAITSEDFKSRPVVSINQALQGQMPGVTVVNTNGRPGTNNTNIRIRGIGTLNDANPLVVIDGVPGGDMSILNPADIESVSVLKDAASASIYGVRGANGVILVTTRKGKADENGKADINYNGYFGLQTPTALPEMASSVEYMELMNEALINARSNPAWTDQQIQTARDGSDPNYFANTRWVDEIYKNSAPQQNHNLAVNGGMGESSYYLAYGYLNQGGMITGDNYNSHRHNIRARFNTTLFDRLSIDGNIGYVDRNYLGSAEGMTATAGPLNALLSVSPLVPVRFTTGGWGYHGGSRNPVAVTTDGGTDKFNSQEFTGNLQASLRLWDGLRLRGQFGNVRYHTRRNIYLQTIDYIDPYDNLVYQTNVQNSMQARSFTQNYISLMGMLEYEKTFAKDHYVKAMLAASQEEELSNDINASRADFLVDGIPSLNIGTDNQQNTNPATQWALRSFFGRVNYAYKDRYLLEGNFRRDGSSRFAPSVRWDWFGSVSAGWIFSEESFFSSLKDIINVGKIRFSYGTQGNDRVIGGDGQRSNFAYMSIYASRNTMPIGNVLTNAFWQPNVANEILTWEKAIKRDIGVDLALLNNRLNVTADYYFNSTTDILLTVPLPDVFGANYPPQNAGNVENRGWELQVGWRSAVNDFRYGVTANLSDVKNKVTGYGGASPIIESPIRRVGDPIDAFYGLVADRIAQEADFDYNPTTGAYIPRFPHIDGDPLGPGDIIYKVLSPTTDPSKAYDINDPEREYISLDKDRQVIGDAIPRYTYGLRSDMSWKGFDFSFFLQGVGKINGLIEGKGRHALTGEGNMPQQVHLDRWTADNPDASYPRLVYNQSYNTRLSTFWLEDASYMRLKNIQLGYTLPRSITKFNSISNVRVYASADNLFTNTDFFYAFDPEVPVTSNGLYPQVKTFIFGLSFNLK